MHQDADVTKKDGLSWGEGEGRERPGGPKTAAVKRDCVIMRPALHLLPKHSQMGYLKGLLCTVVSSRVQPVGSLWVGWRGEGLHQTTSSWVPWLKVNDHSRQPINHESLDLGFDHNSLVPSFMWLLLLVPDSCIIPCGLFTCMFANAVFLKHSLNFSTLSIPSVSLLGLWLIPW
jgi:hypothetical protein